MARRSLHVINSPSELAEKAQHAKMWRNERARDEFYRSYEGYPRRGEGLRRNPYPFIETDPWQLVPGYEPRINPYTGEPQLRYYTPKSLEMERGQWKGRSLSKKVIRANVMRELDYYRTWQKRLKAIEGKSRKPFREERAQILSHMADTKKMLRLWLGEARKLKYTKTRGSR